MSSRAIDSESGLRRVAERFSWRRGVGRKLSLTCHEQLSRTTLFFACENFLRAYLGAGCPVPLANRARWGWLADRCYSAALQIFQIKADEYNRISGRRP
jgi:hypothetical protein